jgi:hypothetical protein
MAETYTLAMLRNILASEILARAVSTAKISPQRKENKVSGIV